MLEQATEQTTIGAPPDRCFEVAADIAAYPEWAGYVKEAEVLDRAGDGRPQRAAFRAAAMGHSARYVLRYTEVDAPRRLAWVLEEGDVMRRLDGAYEFEPVDGDPGATLVTYRLAVELAVPLPGFVKRRAEGKILLTALDELKRRCEATASDAA